VKRLAVCLALVLPLAVAGGAAAKEVVSAKVCGASECRTVKDRDALLALHEGGAPTDPPDAAAAFYRAELTVRGDGEWIRFPIALVPSAGLVRGGTEEEGYTWMPVSARAVREFRGFTAGLVPFPATRLTGLDASGLREARVDEVVPPPPSAAASRSDGAGPLWPWLAGALAALGVAAILRRRRASPGSPEPAGG
jgi:MYXO-CTERM domain-containing protein